MIWLWLWGIVTAASLVVEFLTADLVTIWFAAGGLVTLLVVALVPEIALIWQLLIFVGVSVILLLCTRKICLKLLKNEGLKTNTDALIGIKFTVKDVQESYTYHKINDVQWRIYAIDGESLEVGAEFEICQIVGNKLIAKKVTKK
jgi:membrane protein implicated in regulation of membrane protease activity